MKKNNLMKSVLFCFMLFVGFAVTGMKAECAETQINPSVSQSSAPTMSVNKDYWAPTNGLGWVSFVAPSQVGYIEVEYKNLSIDGWAYAGIYTAVNERLARDDAYKESNSVTFRFRSDPDGDSIGAAMEPGIRYYIQVGKEGYTGNVKLTVRFRQDSNRDAKQYAETIQLNKEYTRSIDGYAANKDDYDYFKFTAISSGAHHIKLNNSCSDGWLNYAVHKWNSDELVKKTNGSDAKSDVYRGNTTELDVTLEKGQSYYLKIWHDYIGNYTFSISNQCVKSISMNSTLKMQPSTTYKLNPTVSPAAAYNKKLKYTSDNTSVAWVDSSTGEIHAYHAGKAVITATATDGSNVSARCTVYVYPTKPYAPYWSKSTNTAIKMSWSSVSYASGYTVYRLDGKKWKAVKTTTGTTCTISKLKAGTGYKFRVRAYVNADGKKYSSYSDIGYFATTPKKNSISSIQKLKKKKSGVGYYYRATVKWKKSTGANRYKLYYRVPGSSYKYLVGTYKGTKATVSLYYSKYSSGSKTRTYYVVPVKNYSGRDYVGAYSKGKSYKFK